MKRCVCTLSEGPNYRRADFLAGLTACGYEIVANLPKPKPGDLLVTWNRHGAKDALARHFEAAGATVLVVENGHLGKVWRGRKWFALARGHHAGAGDWPDGGPARWDGWNVEMAPWREGRDVIVLEQRGIGEPGIASPPGWANHVQARIGGRIRRHPGADVPAVSLADDLKDARCVVTWHSSAALHAILLGVPVFYEFPQWIGAGAARHLSEFHKGPKHGDRLGMFRRLAWAMATDEEVRSGEAIARLVAC